MQARACHSRSPGKRQVSIRSQANSATASTILNALLMNLFSVTAVVKVMRPDFGFINHAKLGIMWNVQI